MNINGKILDIGTNEHGNHLIVIIEPSKLLDDRELVKLNGERVRISITIIEE